MSDRTLIAAVDAYYQRSQFIKVISSVIAKIFERPNIVSSISLLDAYRSEKQTARRRGMLNVRFRPVMHLRGDDDWRKQIGMETLNNQMMDENGIVFDLNPTSNSRK
ncbi:hypothetical protein ANCCEY_00097 [Ancylostoma ceylanicum]|uniref:Uncharacterized protein n=1 Tax=Ancylostoma ceylanicum TaxID=53326 RepID=A0A0D6M9V5_9BILA|nr:hypothetical protein ANCCEY_00097 [Ancylostoma ceylanicum]